VLITLPLSDAFIWALPMRHVISLVIFTASAEHET